MKTEHKYAQVLRWIADGEELQARRTNEVMDWKNFPEEFSSAFTHAILFEAVENMEFRLKPRTITLNGREIVAGEKVAPKGEYFLAAPLNGPFFATHTWSDDSNHERYLQRGLVHLTKENAIAHAKAMLGID